MNETIPAEIKRVLERFHFDRIPFETLRARLTQNDDLEAMHMIREPVSIPDARSVEALPDATSDAGRALRAEGEALIARGELGVVVLAGGMATRFGSKVKALAQLFPERAERFLDVKLADIQRAGGTGAIDTTIMTSFATDEAIGGALTDPAVSRAQQFASLRLTPKGELFRDDSGTPSLHATGHGDLPEALQLSGTLERLRRRGVRTVLMMNVDNLGATVDPALLALHRRHGAPITVELVSKVRGDKGGMPVVRNGQLVLAEAFRLPKEFPQDQFPLFNTNTLWFDLEALEGTHDWTWCVARKKVDGREAIQFERLIGELTWWYPTRYVHVPRDGAQSRFIPIKEIDDLERSRTDIEAVLRSRVGING